MIIDAHVHLDGPRYTYKGEEQIWSAERIADVLDQSGIDKAVIFTYQGLAPFVDYRRFNDQVAEAAKAFPDRFIGFGTLDVLGDPEGGPAEAERIVEELGLTGMKLHPWMQGFPANSPDLRPIFDVASEYRLPVIFHTGTPPYAQPFQVAEHAPDFPEVQFIIGHFGKLMWLDAVRSAMRYGNIYLETSGAQVSDIETAIEVVGPEKIVFGTDLPLGGVGAALWNIAKIESLNIPEEAKDRVFSRNIQEILGRVAIPKKT